MTTQIISTEEVASTSTRPSPGLVRGGIGSTLVALGAVAGAWLLATAVTGGLVVDLGAGPQKVGVLAVVGATLVGGGVGIGLAALTRRFSRRPRRAFLVVCVLALAGYAIVPFVAAESLSVAIWLNVLHLVVGVVVSGRLAQLLPGKRR
jgi:hypothetical protein